MSLAWSTLKCKGSCIGSPVAAPKEDVVIFEVIGGRLLLNRNGFQSRVEPDQRPVVLSIDLFEIPQPRGHTLSFRIVEPLREPIEQIVVGVEVTVWMRARILVPFAAPGQRSFKD